MFRKAFWEETLPAASRTPRWPTVGGTLLKIKREEPGVGALFPRSGGISHHQARAP